MHDDVYLIWLTRIEGVGIKTTNLLLQHFNTAKEIFYAGYIEFQDIKGIGPVYVKRILTSQKIELLEKYHNELVNNKITYISKFNSKYPKLLKTIDDPPIGIYVIGELPDDELTKVSIVGSRKCTYYGSSVSRVFGRDLAKHNIVIVSGMARGIDTEAHKGALEADGYTIAVLGCGVDICYPPENARLREQIIKNGCIISEYPPGTSPLATNFPRRNRIISGLSQGIVVVEAGRRSGTLITVSQALEQGRDVFSVPGNITSKFSVGTNRLIVDGAIPAVSHKSVLNELNLVTDNKSEQTDNKKMLSLAQEEKLVYDCISFEPVDLESLIESTKSEISTLQYILTMLELKGYIKKISGQRYVKNL